ncbi:hypothetical protein I5G72_gp14 [Mycobacterium phage Collard]|uniref:BrnT-like toxin n=1 Tax=Mycobacterium phage Collard TaxID=2301704 RepID=A0A385DXJ0_9CAUD|nr:hypothetical protein I5G72_gp14 [Mycobacterium phage Collard]AXQ63259.1 hypothetical protein SEA_COLLARD_85 [Mycobacterium phage Collard]UEM46478.1 BrnT-like toxin [Mycobacterium phage InvictusManeo]
MANWADDRAEHLWERRKTTIRQAEEALNDPQRVTLDPDPARREGGNGIRVVGYSPTAGRVLCVIVVPYEGELWGATAFPANKTYQRIYQEGA